MKYYTEEHEWVEVAGNLATIGITAFAAAELGDLTYIELPAVGKTITRGQPFCVVESVKAASDVFAPIGGTVKEANQKLDSDPGIINSSPETDGWICKVEGINPADLNGLMTAEQYAVFTARAKKK